MTKEPTTVEKMRGLPWGIAFDTANSVYCQLTILGSLFVLYLNELGLNKTQIGALLSLFPFTALLALHTMHVGFSQRQGNIFARAFSIGGVDSD